MDEPTPFQTVGPFFHLTLPFAGGGTVAGAGARIVIEGTLRDGSGVPAPDALIETWQADAAGRYNHVEDARRGDCDPAFDGFARVATDAGGRFALETVKPGPVPGPGGRSQAPHLLVTILARGLLTRLVTRLYFADEPSNDADPILERVPVPRRATLMAARVGQGRYLFDIVLQGEGETVFFDV
jgi:protocatechuate 3,4-dioxygenase, alpha subunit